MAAIYKSAGMGKILPVSGICGDAGCDRAVVIERPDAFLAWFFHIGLNFRGGIYIIFLYSRRFPYDGEAVK